MPAAENGGETILVTDCGRGSAIAFLRSLARRGWRVIASDSDPRSSGFRSRYAADRLVYPDPTCRPEAFVEALRQGVCAHGVDLVIPITDETILPLSDARPSFEGLCKLALPEAEALEVARDKHRTFELAERLGVPAPRSRLVHTREEALDEAVHFRWPIVLKPRSSRIYRDHGGIEAFEVGYAQSPERLAERMQRFEGRCAVMLQEYAEGTGCGVEILAHRGRPLAAFQHRRIHEVPVQGGRSALRESSRIEPALYDHSVRLLSALEWTGLAMVEFRVGEAGPMLMEINGRVWGSLPLAVHSGMDFPRRLAELYLLGPPDSDEPARRDYRVGVRGQSLELELKWIASLLARRGLPFLPWPRRSEALRALVGLFDPRIRFDIQSLEDPRPGLADLSQIFRGFASRLRRARAGSSVGRPLAAHGVGADES